jgi:hypothetical protein
MRGLQVAQAELLQAIAVVLLASTEIELSILFFLLSAVILEEGAAAQADRFRAYLKRADLTRPEQSSWKHLKAAGNDGAYIRYLGFDKATFDVLAAAFTASWPERDPSKPRPKGGRPPSLWADDVLALTLAWITSNAEGYHFQLEFGLPPSTMSETLQQGLVRLLHLLRELPESAVNLPSREECALFAHIIKSQYGTDPLIHSTMFPIGFMDGTVFPIEQHWQRDLQQIYYSGFKGIHCINNIFLFAPDGTVRYAVYNRPGSWHDNHVASPALDAFENSFVQWGFGVLADSAFLSGRTKGYIYTPLKKNSVLPADKEQRWLARKRSDWVVLHRQAAEWGMRALKATFPRLLVALPLDGTARDRLLETCIRLFNIRARRVGLVQIQSVFMPELRLRAQAMEVESLIWESDPDE